MKTKKQLEHFLRNRKYRTRIDFDLISSYCRTKFGLKLHEPSYFVTNTGITASIFQDWLENGFGGGDVVMSGKDICLVQSSEPKESRICFKIDSGGAHTCDITLPTISLQLAKEDAKKRIYDSLDEQGLEFGNPFFVITPQYKPTSGDLVSFVNKKTGEEGVGVVRQCYQTGRVTMFCYVVKGFEPKYNMEEEFGQVVDFRFASHSPADYARKYLESALNKVGKTWNHSLKRIEPMNLEVKKGDKYWFISDKRTVQEAVEKKTIVSHQRYLAGNYFKSNEEALEMLAEQNELIRKFLARPEKKSEPTKK